MKSENEVPSKDVQKVAQLWCLPQHSKKEMDTEFAQSIVELLARVRQDQREADARIALDEYPMPLEVWEMSKADFAGELAKRIAAAIIASANPEGGREASHG